MMKSYNQLRATLRKENLKHGSELKELDLSVLPFNQNSKSIRIRALRSNRFLVQVFEEKDGTIRLTVNRTDILPNGRWVDGITWDELMEIKRQCGYGERFAVEIYPEDSHMIDVANMRHLWLCDRMPFAWSNQ